MKRIIRFSVWVVFIAVVALTVTSYKVTAQNGTGACANCTKKAEVRKCNGSEADITFFGGATEVSGNCVASAADTEQVDTTNPPDGTPDTTVACVITTYYTCQGADQGCGLMQACGGQ